MEDFEYSVEICDRDWECFFAECEECSLLPPSLAGVDDSGMSDIDDAGSLLARRVQRFDPPVGCLDTDWSMDGPPDCEGSPVEHCLGRHGTEGIESVLSGSEEDIHLQSVNVFFEGLKGLTGAQRPSQPSQDEVGRNSEAAHKEEEEEEEEEGGLCSGWQQASGSALPKNIPELNCLPARGETAVGKETSRPAASMSHISTMQNVVCELNMSLEPAAGTSEVEGNTSDKAKLLIREYVCAETSPEQRTPHSRFDSSETTSSFEMCMLEDNAKRSGLLTNQLPLSEKPGTDSAINLSIAPEVKGKKEQMPRVSQPDSASARKSASQESSPASVKRRRRKKRRLSAEPCEGAHGCERHAIGKHSDSEEEEFASKGGFPLPEDVSSFYLKERQTNITFYANARSASCTSPANSSPLNRRVNDLQCESHSGPTRCAAEGSDENIVTSNWSGKPSHQPGEHAISTGSNGTNVVTNFQPCCAFRSEESHGLTENPQEFVKGFTKSDPTKDNLRKHLKVAFQKMFDDVNQSDSAEILKCGSAEVKSVSPPLRTEWHAPAVDGGQNDRLSAAKSGAAEEAGNSGRDERTLCQNEAESQQQLETDCHNTNLDGTLLGKTRAEPPPTGAIASRQLPTEAKQFGLRHDRFPGKLSYEVPCTDSSTSVGSSPERNSMTSSELKVAVQQTKRPPESHILCRKYDLYEESTQAEKAEIIEHTNDSESETKPSLSECLLTSLSDLTRVSSVCTLDTDSIMSLSNENITDLSASFCSSVGERDSEGHEETSSVAVDQKDVKSEIKLEPNCDSVSGVVDVTQTLPKPEKGLNSVFAMSSFWSEMEKLTINDILGLRTTSKDASPSFLPTLRESEEAETLAATDSGFFAQIDDCRTEHSEDAASGHRSVGSNSIDFSSPKSVVTWEREPVQGAEFYPGNIMLTTVTNTPQSVLPVKPHQGLRKMSKNISVHNLRVLESESSSCTEARETLQTDRESEKAECLRYEPAPEQGDDVTSSPSSLMDSYRVSLTDVFQYLFGGKQPDPSQSVTDDTSLYLEGNSVPESYDHFFSEFDTESFFYPLISAEDKAGDKPVPIFSCSRSVNRNLQFPEAYEYFFKSSSSDDSSESDEENDFRPVRVVTRFSRNASSSHLSTDIYDNFFTDIGLKQNLFWKTMFSFRNINFTASRAQRDAPSSAALVPVSEGSRSVPRAAHRLNVLGNQDVMFPDPLLHHLEERISRQLAQQPFRYEELQTAVSIPGLDGPLLPLRQSDMCLVCIAFASWVLKTANPQVGDAWKAVLLANVSALSAIRYLRKYVRVKAATSETKLQRAALTD